MRISMVAVVALAGQALAQSPVRVATWNVLGVGARGSAQYNAALATLERLRPDAVAIQEVVGSGDAVNLQNLAADAGYPVVVVPSGNPFGAEMNAVLSRLPLVRSTINTSALLSGDPGANDLTRWLVEATLDVPGEARDLTLVSVHLKAGSFDSDEFRRAVESIRAGQALADLERATAAYVVMGDLNEEVFAVPRSPDPFRAIPAGMPTGWRLGSDLAALLPAGIRNDPFHALLLAEGPGLTAIPARQLDGSEVTRPESGRRLDYILPSRAIVALGPLAEVYDSQDEGLPGGLPKFGAPPAPGTSGIASDHLLVFADITVPGVPPPLHVVFAAPTQVPGLGLVQPWEAVTYTNQTNTWSWLFRGGDHGMTAPIDALAVLPGGRLLLSFVEPTEIAGLNGGPGGGTLVDDSDLVEFVPPPTGFIISTSGPARPFTFFFDGSDVGLDAEFEDIDAVELLGDGRIVFSTTGPYAVPGVSGEDVDLFAFTPATLGEHTAGEFEVYFDGDDVGLSGGTGEDIDAAAVASGGPILLSTAGDFFVTGLSGSNEDVARFTPASLGTLTAGSYALLFDFSSLGIDPAADVAALDTDE